MIYVLILALVVLMGMTVFSLFKGLNAFRQSLDEKHDDDSGTGATQMQLVQNKMMWSRIKYQGLAIVVVMILLAVSR